MFTDDLLAPTRTTRSSLDPARDYDEVILNDELFVDVSRYGVPGAYWCPVTTIAVGSASVYPFKVAVPERGNGQFAAGEVIAWRRPVWLHRLIVEARAYRDDVDSAESPRNERSLPSCGAETPNPGDTSPGAADAAGALTAPRDDA